MTQATRSTSAVQIVHVTIANIYTAAKDSVRKEVLTMAEYINRERARFEAKRYFKNMDEIQEDLDMLFCMLPAENVAPVRHGRWVHHIAGGKQISACWCSVCNVEHETEQNYCPNCGAKMDGGVEAR